MTKARERQTSPFPSFPRRRETRNRGSQEEANKAGVSFLDLSSLALLAERMVFKAKNFYRKDAKFAKKHNTSPAFLSSFALLASSR